MRKATLASLTIDKRILLIHLFSVHRANSSRKHFFFFSYACHEPRLVSHETASSSAECSRDKQPFSFVSGRDSTMWDIVWASPQGHRSVSVSRHFLLQAQQYPCSVRKRFSRDHCCRNPVATWADFQLHGSTDNLWYDDSTDRLSVILLTRYSRVLSSNFTHCRSFRGRFYGSDDLSNSVIALKDDG